MLGAPNAKMFTVVAEACSSAGQSDLAPAEPT